MIEVDTSQWFVEFEYDGERKRIHKYAHVPLDVAMKVNAMGIEDPNERGFALLSELLRRDCGMEPGDLDFSTVNLLVAEMATVDASAGES